RDSASSWNAPPTLAISTFRSQNYLDSHRRAAYRARFLLGGLTDEDARFFDAGVWIFDGAGAGEEGGQAGTCGGGQGRCAGSGGRAQVGGSPRRACRRQDGDYARRPERTASRLSQV